MTALGRWPRPLTRLEFAIGSLATEAQARWQPDALALLDRRRRDALLWRLPLAATAAVMLWEQKDRGRAAARVAFRVTGEHRRVRAMVRLDRWARPMSGPLPALDAGAAAAAFLDGWHASEGQARWSAAREARMGWNLPPGANRPIDCHVSVALLAPDRLGPQKIRVFANDRLVATWRSRRSEPFANRRSFTIPVAAIRGRATLILTFAIDALHVPAALRIGPDRRRLGLQIGLLAIGPDAATKA